MQLQEILGGQFGEISVALQYLFKGWNIRGNEKYKDILMDTGTEELAHIEMIATIHEIEAKENIPPNIC